MYIVPMDLPKYCNKCPFGILRYNKPYWALRCETSNVDGKENGVGTYGYVCNLEFQENKKYTQVMRALIDEDIEKPKWCKLKSLN